MISVATSSTTVDAQLAHHLVTKTSHALKRDTSADLIMGQRQLDVALKYITSPLGRSRELSPLRSLRLRKFRNSGHRLGYRVYGGRTGLDSGVWSLETRVWDRHFLRIH